MIPPAVHLPMSGGVVDVVDVVWEAYASYSTPLDPCPNNGDLRIFPGKRYTADPNRNDRNKVNLVITVTPVVEGYPVRLRVWDVDDPFDQNHPNMPNVFVIDGDTSGPDNRMPGGGADPGVGQWTALTDANGRAEWTVISSMQPGNNYRGGASTMSDGVDDTIITQADVDANNPPPPVKLTHMLTVWRHVWVELDSMGPGSDISYTGTIDQINNNQPHTGDGTVELDVTDINDDGRFEGGTMTVPATGSAYTIIDNVDVFVDDDYTMSTLIAAGDLAQTATVVDDDTAILPKTPDANITVLDNKYKNCYVAFTENSATRDNDNVFVPTLAYDPDVVAAKGFENADLTPAPDFWLAIIVTCYQSHHDASGGDNATSADGDPDKRYHIHGTTFDKGDTALKLARVPEVGGRNVVVFYLETVQDYVAQAANGYWADFGHIPRTLTFIEPRVIAREIGHMFSLVHVPGTLMDKWYGADLGLNAQQLDIVRSSTHMSQH